MGQQTGRTVTSPPRLEPQRQRQVGHGKVHGERITGSPDQTLQKYRIAGIPKSRSWDWSNSIAEPETFSVQQTTIRSGWLDGQSLFCPAVATVWECTSRSDVGRVMAPVQSVGAVLLNNSQRLAQRPVTVLQACPASHQQIAHNPWIMR